MTVFDPLHDTLGEQNGLTQPAYNAWRQNLAVLSSSTWNVRLTSFYGSYRAEKLCFCGFIRLALLYWAGTEPLLQLHLYTEWTEKVWVAHPMPQLSWNLPSNLSIFGKPVSTERSDAEGIDTVSAASCPFSMSSTKLWLCTRPQTSRHFASKYATGSPRFRVGVAKRKISPSEIRNARR